MVQRLTILAGGDVFIDRREPARAFKALGGLLEAAHIRFCNLEAPLTQGGIPYLGKRIRLRSAPTNVRALTGAYDVVSLSNNHMLDYGPEGLSDTLGVLDHWGIEHAGAGSDWESAAKPVILERGGVRVGFVAYSMVGPGPYAAGTDRPGITLIGAETAFVPLADLLLEQPGTPPRVNTRLLPDGHARLESEISAARKACDFLVVSFHWGVAFSTEVADYQREAAHQAVAAGAGLILGHHPHVLQGYQVLRGTPIFFSLGNLAFDYKDARMSPYGLLAYCILEGGTITEIGGIVSRIGADFDVEVVPVDAGRTVVVTTAGIPPELVIPTDAVQDGLRFSTNCW